MSPNKQTKYNFRSESIKKLRFFYMLTALHEYFEEDVVDKSFSLELLLKHKELVKSLLDKDSFVLYGQQGHDISNILSGQP
jgi:hypothetical protein